MIPLTTLYDDYIDRPKLTEQKNNPFEYIVLPPLELVGTIRARIAILHGILSVLEVIFSERNFWPFLLFFQINRHIIRSLIDVISENVTSLLI